MTSYINTSSAWFYEKDSDVLTVNEYSKKVGILTNNPQYELDVRGTVYAQTYCNLPEFAMSNQVFPIANYGSNVASYGSNVASYASNNMVKNGLTVSVSNLQVLDTIKRNNEYFLEPDGKVDYTKWLKNAPEYNNDNSLAVAGLVVGTLGVLSSAGQLLTQYGMGDKLKQDIMDKLGGDEIDPEFDPAEEDIKVHYNNIIYPPIFQNRGKTEVGIQSNLYVSRNAKLCGILHDDLIPYDDGRSKRIATNPDFKVVYDFNNDTLYCDSIDCTYDVLTKELQTSNIITSNLISFSNISTSNLIAWSNITTSNLVAFSNISTSNITTSNISTSNMIGSNIEAIIQYKCGNFYITPQGIYVGNPQLPLTSFQVIDNNGNYKGTINKEQVLNTEALNFNSMADGVVQWTEYTNGLAEFADPFESIDNPLFEI